MKIESCALLASKCQLTAHLLSLKEYLNSVSGFPPLLGSSSWLLQARVWTGQKRGLGSSIAPDTFPLAAMPLAPTDRIEGPAYCGLGSATAGCHWTARASDRKIATGRLLATRLSCFPS